MSLKPKNDIIQSQISIKKNYLSFSDFYSENKILIYKNIVNLYKSLENKKNSILILKLSTIIEGMEWTTDLKFNKEKSIVLKRDILPYFEELEDYEFCGEIKSLYNKII